MRVSVGVVRGGGEVIGIRGEGAGRGGRDGRRAGYRRDDDSRHMSHRCFERTYRDG